jgi:hypothetical protein
MGQGRCVPHDARLQRSQRRTAVCKPCSIPTPRRATNAVAARLLRLPSESDDDVTLAPARRVVGSTSRWVRARSRRLRWLIPDTGCGPHLGLSFGAADSLAGLAIDGLIRSDPPWSEIFGLLSPRGSSTSEWSAGSFDFDEDAFARTFLGGLDHPVHPVVRDSGHAIGSGRVRLAVEELLDAEVVRRFLDVEKSVVLTEKHVWSDLLAQAVPGA